ncbi:MAG: hypothetical protein FJ272_03460 [Planctomycetes bacterium]|nr:hypothetical protein [Planctomycetota bacterium]
MRFLADMGISPDTVAFLRSLGHDAAHLHEQRLHRLDDPGILQKARDEGRILLAHDLDFGELMAASGGKLPSIIVFRLRDMRPDRVNHSLDRVIAAHHELLARGVIVSVSEARIRVHELPVRPGNKEGGQG